MPTLDWIGKKAVLTHHREVPYRLLKCDASLSVGDPGSGNLLVQGDNLLALKALLPYYADKVKCIYIDPPTTPATKAGSTTTTSTVPKFASGSSTSSARKAKTYRATTNGSA